MPDQFEQLGETVLRGVGGKPTYYDRHGKPLLNVMEWAEWLAPEKFEENRRVDERRFYGARVSTVALGLDHNWGDGPPLIFETMVFGGARDGYQWRYHTEVEALAGHRRVVGRLAWPHRLAAALSIVAVLVALVVMAGA